MFEKNIKPIFIGNGLMRMVFFTFLTGDLMVMTLSDLGNYELKKSKLCKQYLYIFHSMCSTFKSYTEKAFDNYDVIFANGLHQIDEIKKNEKINNLRQKKIYNTGYLYLENLKKKIKIDEANGSILFAPSWSKDKKKDLIEVHGLKILKELIFLSPKRS